MDEKLLNTSSDWAGNESILGRHRDLCIEFNLASLDRFASLPSIGFVSLHIIAFVSLHIIAFVSLRRTSLSEWSLEKFVSLRSRSAPGGCEIISPATAPATSSVAARLEEWVTRTLLDPHSLHSCDRILFACFAS
jgi:hypothetical protein